MHPWDREAKVTIKIWTEWRKIPSCHSHTWCTSNTATEPAVRFYQHRADIWGNCHPWRRFLLQRGLPPRTGGDKHHSQVL